MKKLLTVPTRLIFPTLLTVALAASLWVATLPTARARVMSPKEMIEEGLPPGKTMDDATKPEFLAAVCAAVRSHEPDAPAITRAAVLAHRPFAGDIVATVTRCGPKGDCGFVGTIVRAAIQVAPSEASVVDDAALATAPDCADAIQASTGGSGSGREIADSKDGKEILDGKDVPAEGPAGVEGFGSAPSNQLPLPGSTGGGGGGFQPGENVFSVCDNGTQRSIRESELGPFLLSHPGAFVGSCQPTPTTNR
ncbi:MAG: hypothetical protein H0X40_13215 [Chthoniobacterales bacterium]|nr:hypothetical protein [Chthoniobacterales bacterium]